MARKLKVRSTANKKTKTQRTKKKLCEDSLRVFTPCKTIGYQMFIMKFRRESKSATEQSYTQLMMVQSGKYLLDDHKALGSITSIQLNIQAQYETLVIPVLGR